jgi:esterase
MDLNFTEIGDGPPLVILHGLYGSSRNWAGIAKTLSGQRRVIAVDLPNHGASPWLEAISYEALADAVAEFISGHDLTGCALLGHSMGGKTAMVLAQRHADLIDALIVADIAPVAYDHDRENGDIIGALQAVPLDELTRRGDADAHLESVVPNAAIRAFLLQNLVQADGKFSWRIDLNGLAVSLDAIHGFPPPLEAFQKPALFIAGGQSAYVRPQHNAIIFEQFPEARIEVLSDAGHWLHAEDPAGFVTILQEFLGD